MIIMQHAFKFWTLSRLFTIGSLLYNFNITQIIHEYIKERERERARDRECEAEREKKVENE